MNAAFLIVYGALITIWSCVSILALIFFVPSFVLFALSGFFEEALIKCVDHKQCAMADSVFHKKREAISLWLGRKYGMPGFLAAAVGTAVLVSVLFPIHFVCITFFGKNIF